MLLSISEHVELISLRSLNGGEFCYSIDFCLQRKVRGLVCMSLSTYALLLYRSVRGGSKYVIIILVCIRSLYIYTFLFIPVADFRENLGLNAN